MLQTLPTNANKKKRIGVGGGYIGRYSGPTTHYCYKSLLTRYTAASSNRTSTLKPCADLELVELASGLISGAAASLSAIEELTEAKSLSFLGSQARILAAVGLEYLSRGELMRWELGKVLLKGLELWWNRTALGIVESAVRTFRRAVCLSD